MIKNNELIEFLNTFSSFYLIDSELLVNYYVAHLFVMKSILLSFIFIYYKRSVHKLYKKTL